ncbi:uncharacterized protein LOC109726322 [Ananas comosus]|uniref:Uncharacterized protein LOC109726322 n=1 Tax=Ananas comosus TaxID=4615 RepID=A0A6P5GUC1_ANACO|nr:uncharacterized protein LOC109726322 [Ananas comosus]
MIQNYQDAIAICRCHGQPDLFITFTCNAQWLEIRNALNFIPGQKPEDRPDFVSRIFKIKLQKLMDDIRKHQFFGRTTAVLYTIEFQKRGLPHAHILVWLQQEDKYLTTEAIDSIISAEIPDRDSDPLGYESVAKFMIHGPCGTLNFDSPCMKKGHCSKHFPKEYRQKTIINENGFAIYKRKDDQRYVKKSGNNLDNRFVVPYNRDLIVKYQAHINVEWCNKSRMIKYLFKYVSKGPDRTRAVIEDNVTINEKGDRQYEEIDEVKKYLDCRYLSAYEAMWRLFEFDIHFREPSVERLTIHLPLMHKVTYHASQFLEYVLNRPDIGKTMFTEWMHTNEIFEDARELTYAEFPTKWVWNAKDKIWTRRKQGNRIGRIVHIHPTSGELYYLRILLNVVKGARNYVDIRTIDGIEYPTYQSACHALGLLGDDREWDQALNEAANWASSDKLRQLFVTLLMFCQVADPTKLLETHWTMLMDDIGYKLQKLLDIPNLKIPDAELKNHLLLELEILFNKNCSSLHEFNLPLPNRNLFEQTNNRLIREELSYNIEQLQNEHVELVKGLNDEQEIIYNAVVQSVFGNKEFDLQEK